MKTNDTIFDLKFKIISVVVLLSFVGGIIYGYYVSANFKFELITTLVDFIQKITEGKVAYDLTYIIFFNNLKVALLLFILGLTLILPLLILFANAMNLGVLDFAITRLFDILQINAKGFAWKGIIIHGVFELSAIMIATILGIYLGIYFLKYVFRLLNYYFNSGKKFQFDPRYRDYNKSKSELFYVTKKTIFYFIILIIPLLTIAAFLEVFVTPMYLEYSFSESVNSTIYKNFESNLEIKDCTLSNNSVANFNVDKLLPYVVYDNYKSSLGLFFNESLNTKFIQESNTTYFKVLSLNKLAKNPQFTISRDDFLVFLNATDIKYHYNGSDCYVLFDAEFKCTSQTKYTKNLLCE